MTPPLPAPRNSEKSVPLACTPRYIVPPCVLSVSLCVPTGLLDWCRYVGVRIVLLAYGQLIALCPGHCEQIVQFVPLSPYGRQDTLRLCAACHCEQIVHKALVVKLCAM